MHANTIKKHFSTAQLFEAAFFLVFFIGLTGVNLWPDTGLSHNIICIPLLFVFSFIPLFQQSGRQTLQQHAYFCGIALAVLIFFLLQYVFPLIPSWASVTAETVYFCLFAVTTLQKGYERILRVFAAASFFNILDLALSTLGGLAEPLVYLERSVIRSSLTAGHPNQVSKQLLVLIIVLSLGNIVRSVWFNLILALCVYWFCSVISHTRSAAILCIVYVIALLLEWLYQHQKGPGLFSTLLHMLDFIAVMAFPLNCVLWFGLIYCVPYHFAVVERINALLANRLYLAYDAIKAYGISPFGFLLRSDWHFIDNGFTNILINYGLVVLIFLGIAWLLVSVRFFYAGKRRLLYAFAFLALWGGEGDVLLASLPNIFFYLALSDLSADTSSYEQKHSRQDTVILACLFSLGAVFIGLSPVLFPRMRTITQLLSVSGTQHPFRLRIICTIFILYLLFGSICRLIHTYLQDRHLSKKALAVTGICCAVIAMNTISGNNTMHFFASDLQAMADADAPAIETILSAKTGNLCADPYPAFYRKHFPGISPSVLYGKDLARFENTTVITSIDLDGGNTFQTQGFQYAPISEMHAVYSNDEAVIASLSNAGYPVSPFFNRRFHVDLEACARDSYLVYEPSFAAIVIDQFSKVEEQRSTHIWTNYNLLYGGTYEVTFTCRLLWPEETDPESYCILGVNYSHGSEIVHYDLRPAEADENNRITITLPFLFLINNTVHWYRSPCTMEISAA